MRWLASNLRTFLLAVVLGLAVWVSAVSAADPDVVRAFPRPIPIEVIGQDPSLIRTSEPPTSLNLTLRAPSSVWEALETQENAVRAILDLSGLSSGEHTLEVQVQVALRPVQIVLKNPSTVTVQLESLVSKTLPLIPSLTGQPAAGYQAGDATLAAQEVLISGPESLVEDAMRARVTVNLDGIRESIENEPVPIQIINSKNEILRGLTINPETVLTSVPIILQGGFRDLAVKVVVTGQQAPGYRLENISVFPPVITVFSTDSTLVSSLPGVVETQPLDLQDAREDISTRLSLDLPENVTLIGAQTVQVQVSITPIQTSVTLSNLPINVIGLDERLSAQPFPQSVDVIISGPVPVLETLVAEDVEITVDVSGLGIGTYQLEPSVDTGNMSDVLVESILPGTVEVVLSIPGTATPTAFPTVNP
ncbi:MAG TPA: CdaR family protein [Anaerolineales bacterium]|nr:CdaR family protein [Anaerolineales bacterium]